MTFTYSVSATTSTGLTVSAGQSIGVFGGGIASSILIEGSGTVSSGGSAVGTTLDGGTLTVFAGGSASDTIIDPTGQEVVSGGSDTSASVDGGLQTVASGGTAVGATLSGVPNTTGTFYVASQAVLSGGTASGTQVGTFGEQDVSGGTAVATVVSNGNLFLEDGTVSRSVLLSGATQYDDAGTAIGTTISSGGIELVEFGYVSANSAGFGATGSIVRSAGSQVVQGGVASATVVSSGGTQVVVADVTPVISGSAVSAPAGTAFATVVSSGGSQLVSSGGSVYSAMVLDGGSQSLGSGGIASDTRVNAGGTEVVSGGIAYGTTLAGGTELVEGGGSATGFVDFTATGGDLELSGTALTTATISGFGAGDRIDLLNIAPTSVGAAPYAAGALTVTEGGTAYVLNFDPAHSYAGEVFSVTDGGGFTEITVTCFCTGTRIATPRGETPVERLRAGRLVRLADGRSLPVRWIGRQRVALRFADPPRAWPVRLRAGALGANLPCRDLLVSPGHALLLDGVLVQAGALVNGCSIVRERPAADFTYWHVELAEHALLLAEGVAAESYLESAEPVGFDNAGKRPPGPQPAELDLPRVRSARQLPAALRRRLLPDAAA